MQCSMQSAAASPEQTLCMACLATTDMEASSVAAGLTNDDGEGLALAILTAVALAIVEVAKGGGGTVDQVSP